MSSELVPYDPARTGRKVPPRQSHCPSSRTLPVRFSEEVVEQLDALLTAARERDPARAESTDLMTASLGTLFIERELRTAREREERLRDQWRW